MPTINLRDPRNRDATVSAEPVAQIATVRYVDTTGAATKLQHVLKSTSEHTLERLLAKAGGEDQITQHLISEDTDTDIERVGMFLKGANRVYVNEAGETVFRIAQTEIIRGPMGEEKARRPRKQQSPNIETEFPVSWTGRLIKKDDAIRSFVFSSKLQIVHINGLTYDFLYAMAKELADAKSLMLLGGGKTGKEPLVFRRGATPHRGFLEGRIDGERYVLILHLSKLELKRPVVQDAAAVVASEPRDVAVPAPAPISPALVPLEKPADTVPPLAASTAIPTHKPTVAEVLAATANTPTPGPAASVPAVKDKTAVAIKTSKRNKIAADVQTKTGSENGKSGVGSAQATSDKAPPKSRAARKPKTEATQTKS